MQSRKDVIGVRATAGPVRIAWRRVFRSLVDTLAWTAVLPGAVSAEVMECLLGNRLRTTAGERPLSRAERRKWASVVAGFDLPSHRR